MLTLVAIRAMYPANPDPGLVIAACIAELATGDSNQLEIVSARIHTVFSAGRLPEDITRVVANEYCLLDPQSTSVAVRSSATTEDLPDLSFAGQQDTYLNVVGEAQLRNTSLTV